MRHGGKGLSSAAAVEHAEPAGLTPGLKLSAGKSSIRLGEAELDLSGVEQLVEHSQVRAVGEAMLMLGGKGMDGATPIDEMLAALQTELARSGIDALKPGWRLGNLAMPRSLEIAAALCRFRSLAVARTVPSAARSMQQG